MGYFRFFVVELGCLQDLVGNAPILKIGEESPDS